MDVQLNAITKRYTGSQNGVHAVSLAVRHGEFLVLLGPSGCGKTTTLRCIAGLETPDSGSIAIGERTVYDGEKRIFVPPEHRGLGMVFQSYAIWPHMTVYENVAYGLTVRRRPKAAVKEKVEQALELVGLAGLGSRPATNLSGGQMQRVALARSLAMDPLVLLLDEPLSNLDLKLRERLRFELKEIQIKTGLTMIYVTHDQTEAVALSDRIAVLNAGKVVQESTPQELFTRPVNTFVADFLGSANILPGRYLGLAEGGWALVEVKGGVLVACPKPDQPLPEGQDVYLAIHPEDVKMRAPEADDTARANSWVARVEVPNFLGTHTRYALDLAGNRTYAVALGTHVEFRTGQSVAISVNPDKVMMLLE